MKYSKKKTLSWIGVALLALSVSACSKSAAGPTATTTLPEEWYRLPEDGAKTPSGLREPSAQVTEAFDETLDAQKETLEGLSPGSSGISSMGTFPKDLAPWHLSAFMTDLAVSAQGILGSLTAKGTPAISLIWAKRESKQAITTEAAADITVTAAASAAEIDDQLDTAVRAAMATGKIKDESRLRRELGVTLSDFRELTRGLDDCTGPQWWPSRVRLDVLVDASGSAGFFSSLGSEVRLRFEWHRAKHAHPAVAADSSVRLSPRMTEAKRSFRELVSAVASDLSVLPVPASHSQGYQPYLFRVGVGMTAGGTFGVVKSNATVLGQVYFSQDVPKPSLKPKALPLMASDEDAGTINLIETGSSQEHLGFARSNAIAVDEAAGGIEQVVYKVNRAQLRRGLAKAERMAGFFARRASRVRHGKWGLYEIRASFDMSLSGKLGLATVGGLATAEIDLFNEDY